VTVRTTEPQSELEELKARARELEEKLAARTRELAEAREHLAEALEQQTATSEILKVVSRSAFDLQPVLDNVLQNAVRLCSADKGLIYRQDGGVYRIAVSYGHSPGWIEMIKRYPIRPDRGSATGRAVLDRRVVHIHDILADPDYHWAEDQRRNEEMHRTILAAPMLRDEAIIGVIVVRRTQVEPFTDKQIALVTSFASQAVIAIENTRLLNELRESLQQQIATSEVLKVISSSPGELQPVFQAMLEHATRICEANFGVMNLHDHGLMRMAAMHNVPPAFAEWLQASPDGYQPMPSSASDIVMRTKQVAHVLDNAAQAVPGRAATLGGARSTVCVPMLKDDALIGMITIYPAVHRQADRAAAALRQPGRHRHREYAAAQRAARIAAAADRHRRRAQSH
jgi:GAF domain-containing protein